MPGDRRSREARFRHDFFAGEHFSCLYVVLPHEGLDARFSRLSRDAFLTVRLLQFRELVFA